MHPVDQCRFLDTTVLTQNVGSSVVVVEKNLVSSTIFTFETIFLKKSMKSSENDTEDRFPDK